MKNINKYQALHDYMKSISLPCTISFENDSEEKRAEVKAQISKDGVSSIEDREYLVLTYDEAEEMYEEYLDNYIDDFLEIPDHIEMYFDREAWKRDARINDGGFGNALAQYDSEENEITVNDVTYYIYRTN